MRTLLALERHIWEIFILDQTKSAGSKIKRRVHFIKLNMMSIVNLDAYVSCVSSNSWLLKRSFHIVNQEL